MNISTTFLKKPLLINIIISTPEGENPVNFKISEGEDSNDQRYSKISKALFGEKKTIDRVKDILRLLHNFQIVSHESDLILKVKLLSILYITVAYNLIIYNYDLSKDFYKFLVDPDKRDIYSKIPNTPFEMNFGYRLLVEIKAIIRFYLNSYGKNEELNSMIIFELKDTILGFLQMYKLEQTKENYDKFFELRAKRVNVKINVLIELTLAENINQYNYKNEPNFKVDLNEYLAFGDYLNIISSLQRDSKRDLDTNFNAYVYFCKYFDPKDYATYHSGKKAELLEKFKNNVLLMNCLKNSEESLKKHYDSYSVAKF